VGETRGAHGSAKRSTVRLDLARSSVGGRVRFGDFAGEVQDAVDHDLCAGPDAERPVPPEPFACVLE